MMQKRNSSWRALALALLLGLLFLAVCVRLSYYEFYFALKSDRVSVSLLSAETLLTGTLWQQLIGFAGATLVLHLLFGLAAWALALALRRSLGAMQSVNLSYLVIVCFLGLALCAHALNTTWFPASTLAATNTWMSGYWGPWPASLWLSSSLALLMMALLVKELAGAFSVARRKAMVLAGVTIAITGTSVLWSSAGEQAPFATTGRSSPNIIILGVDSLRDDLAAPGSESPATPNMDDFLDGAYRFTDTISPLPRTYPAWVSILSGRHPVTTNARFNLMPRALVHEGDTLAEVLKGNGYQTFYATDETRFSNIDESFGFETLATPPVGAVDFLVSKASDLPLINLLSRTSFHRWWFPVTYANRAAFVTYEPSQFVGSLERYISPVGPGFYAIHLTLPHWPYSWANQERPTTPQTYRPAYRSAIEAVDRQFADVLRVLKAKGLLRNAIVVVLSDHGEALGAPADTMLRQTGSPDEIWNSVWGHGTSVMSQPQYSVLLAMRAYGSARLPGTPGSYDWPVSLEDVRPTLQQLATGSPPTNIDGRSLVPLLADPSLAVDFRSRIRFTETGFNTQMILAGKYDESGLIKEGVAYYELERERGWVQLRSERLPELVARKERAAVSMTHLLAAIPDSTDGSLTYLYSDRRVPAPERLTGRPNPNSNPDAARLWDALHTRFPGELPELGVHSPM